MISGDTLDRALQAFRVLNPWWQSAETAHSMPLPHPRRLFDVMARHLERPESTPALLVGLRRIGKTTLTLQLVQSLANRLRLPPGTTLYIDCQQSLLAGMALGDLYDAFDQQVRQPELPCVIAIDEVQYLERWHLQLRDLIHRTRGSSVHLIATGSNPGELRRASGRELLDRVMLFPMRTMTFGECVELVGQNVPLDPRRAPELAQMFESYLFRGGFPDLWRNESSQQESCTRVRNICDLQVIDGDVAGRLAIRNRTGFRKLWAHLVTHPGEECNASALARGLSLGSEGVGIWVEGLLQVELLSEVLPTETSGEALHGRKRHSRLYPADPAFVAAYGFATEQGPGLETLVLRQLRELVHAFEQESAAQAFVGFWKSRGKGKSRDIDFRLLSSGVDLPVSVKGAREAHNNDVARLAVVAKELNVSRALLLHMGLARGTTEKQGVEVTALPVLDFLLRADHCGGNFDVLLSE